MKKRIIAIVIALTLLVICFPAAMAETKGVLSSEGVKLKPGGSGELTVSITSNPGLCGFSVYVRCDTEIFSLEADEENGGFTVKAGELFSKGSMLCAADGTKGWKVTWYSTSAVRGDGEMFSLRISSKDGTPSGEYDVSIGCIERNTVDANLAAVALEGSQSTITVLSTKATFSVRDITAVAGHDAVITVDIDVNPGIASCLVNMTCDVKTFEAQKNSDGDYIVELGSFSSGGSVMMNLYGTQDYPRGYKLAWFREVESINTGSVFEIPVTVAADAEPGEYEISIKVPSANLTNVKGEQIECTTVAGTVTIVPAALDEVSAQCSQNSVTVSVDVKNGGEESFLICGLYTADGKMLSVKFITLEACDGGESKTINFDHEAQEGEYIEVFIVEPDSFAAHVLSQTVPLMDKEVG